MAAREIPNNAAIAKSERVWFLSCGRQTSTRSTAANPTRKKTVPPGPNAGNRCLAMPAPNCTDAMERMTNPVGGTEPAATLSRPAFVARLLRAVTLSDLQAFADSLAGLAPSSRARTLATVKPLLAFGQRTDYLPLNVGAALKLPPKKDRLAERILSETRSTTSSP